MMKYAITQKPHGRPGAMLTSIKEAMEDLETVARLYRLPVKLLQKKFTVCGYNVFNKQWKEFIVASAVTRKQLLNRLGE